MPVPRHISLRGVEVHNLQSLDIDLPHRRMIVLCGVSGSGKSSLAFDTLYAEAQRRYIETFSTYTRQFLERLEKPAAERIDGLPPAIAVSQGHEGRSGRSTVATATEIHDHLRLLYARIGRVHCLSCGREVRRDTPQTAAEFVGALPAGTRFLVTFVPQPAQTDEVQNIAASLASLREAGFQRVIFAGRMWTFSEMPADALAAAPVDEPLFVVVDRLTAGGSVERLRDSLETAFSRGHGAGSLWIEEADRPSISRGAAEQLDGRYWRRIGFSTRLRCEDCNRDYPDPEPRLFSFNSPLGACPTCEGAGVVAEANGRRKSERVCLTCGGARLRPEALAVQIGGRSIAALCGLKIRDAAEFLRQLPLTETEQAVGRMMLEQIQSRLGYLTAVGLDYLPLERSLKTLSGGEAQRVALTAALGSSLVNLLYVLDEPSAGLHPHDTARLIGVIQRLRDRGNTVIVVDHDENIIKVADQVVEIGPGAGDRGGKLVFQGTPAAMQECLTSLTGDYLAGRRMIRVPERRRQPSHGWIRLAGAKGHNLQDVTVEFPLGLLCVVTGVSGAGKSTLVEDTLYPLLCQRLKKAADEPLACQDLLGESQLNDVMLVDQRPIGRSPRSNPVTYIKAFDEIRAVFADTLEARTRGYSAGHFSFNVDGGRCPHCQGEGFIQIDMQFLADVFMKCPQCHGTRYRREVLDCKHRGRSIADVLEMTVREAFLFFRGQQKVQSRLKQLMDVGLDYIRLGQPANTLSGGESQRLKLASYLASARRGRTLFLMDEPTTGLHMHDVAQLLACFESLLAVGHSLIVVEHNLALIRCADYVIDLGPGAADEGGRIVAQGTPEEIARCPESVTGRYLSAGLARQEAAP